MEATPQTVSCTGMNSPAKIWVRAHFKAQKQRHIGFSLTGDSHSGKPNSGPEIRLLVKALMATRGWFLPCRDR
jgi:hypothetical protein